MSNFDDFWPEKLMNKQQLLPHFGVDSPVWNLQECLYTASSFGNDEVIRSSLEKQGCDLNKKNKGSWTPLMYAVYYGHTNVVSLLLNSGASFYIANEKGHNALMIAARCGNEVLVEFLIQAGSVLESRDKMDWTPIFHAIFGGNIKVLQILLSCRANANACVRQSGRTPLMLAALYGDAQIVELLLKSGASPAYVSIADGKTAVDIASEAGQHHIATLINLWLSKVAPSCLRSVPAAVGSLSRNLNSYSLSTTCAVAFDLDNLLSQLGLGDYSYLFREQEVDLQIFLSMNDEDLKECGVKKLGPRRKMNSAIDRWHSNAPILSGLEAAYALKLQVEVQQSNERLNEMKSRIHEVHKTCRVIREHLTTAIYNACHFPQQLPKNLAVMSKYFDELFCLTDDRFL